MVAENVNSKRYEVYQDFMQPAERGGRKYTSVVAVREQRRRRSGVMVFGILCRTRTLARNATSISSIQRQSQTLGAPKYLPQR